MAPSARARSPVLTFDLGGTLLAPHPSVGEIYAEILGQHGFAADPAALNTRFLPALRRWTHALGPRPEPRAETRLWQTIVRETLPPDSVPESAFDRVFTDLFAAFAHGHRWRILPQVIPTLTALRAAGCRLAVLSNSDSRMRTVLRDLDLLRFFEHLFLSAEVGLEKPDPRLFAHLARVLETPPAAILHVGDSERHDAEGARLAGWSHHLVAKDAGLPPPEVLLAATRF